MTKKILKYTAAASGALLATALVLFAILSYVRNWDGGDGTCPKMSRREITGFIEKYAKQNGSPQIVFDENFEYIPDLHQWKVPYRSDGHRYIAKMTCLGIILDNVGPYN
ncbi:hypothetical protein [Burkholderia cenocepacia]|uniref:hypothetical protein n=1 Tax=Burkholderia cenocepacia TaxID=95486 RepID=UPI0012D3220F|nr:hypothetical protein [Burkholderia cenocepacia]MDN7452109.1 hypothetical protein [Burkholderia cenocepacia]MEB2499309.1 hypothetical protein [Burkholderia cenocepacia]MEB2556983.1 hypothetical protein [Burkholderia cenocepacia]